MSILSPFSVEISGVTKYFFLSSFFERVDRALRRSLGVSETAKTEVVVEPAPPKASAPPIDVEEQPFMDPKDFVDFKDIKESLRQKAAGENKPPVFESQKVEETAGTDDPEKMEKSAEDVIKHVEL